MGRYLTGTSVTGTVKSMQQISTGYLSNNNYTTVTITSVNTSKAIIVGNGEYSGYAGAEGNDVAYRSGGASTPLTAYFSSATGVRVDAQNKDVFNRNFRNQSGRFYGTVIEYS